MLAPLRITERTVGDLLILQLAGHLVFDESDRILRDSVHAACEAGARSILLDLHDVKYVDSGGIGAVIELYRYVTRLGGRLGLMCASPCALRALHITHLSSAVTVFDTEESAILGMHAPSAAVAAAYL